MSESTIISHCPGCRKGVRVDAKFVGKTVKCRHCATAWTIAASEPTKTAELTKGEATRTAEATKSQVTKTAGVTKSPGVTRTVASKTAEMTKGEVTATASSMPVSGPARPAPRAATAQLKPAAARKPPREIPAEPDDLQPGRKLANFEIVRLMGRGTMGAVYEARDLLLNRAVALKLLPAGLADSLSDFLREANISNRLEHPNISTVFQAGKQGDLCFFVSELGRSGSAADFVRDNGPMQPADAARIVACVARGLSAAHARGVCHRNVHPNNILLGDLWTVKIADFGQVQSLQKFGVLGPDAAPADFVSPEYCNGQPTSPASDIYSLGAVLYFLVTGSPPYPGNRMAMMAGHMRVKTPDPRQLAPQVPEQAVAIIERAMAKTPADRYASPSEMAAELEQLYRELSGEEVPLDTFQPSAPGQAGTAARAAPTRRKALDPRILWAAGTGVAAVLAIVFTVMAMSGDDDALDPATGKPAKPGTPGIGGGAPLISADKSLELLTGNSGGAGTIGGNTVPDSLRGLIEGQDNRLNQLLLEDNPRLKNRPMACPKCNRAAKNDFALLVRGERVFFCSRKCSEEFLEQAKPAPGRPNLP